MTKSSPKQKIPTNIIFYRTADAEGLLTMAYILRLHHALCTIRSLNIKEYDNPLITGYTHHALHIGGTGDEQSSFVDIINRFGLHGDLKTFENVILEIETSNNMPFKTAFERSIIERDTPLSAKEGEVKSIFRSNLTNAEQLLNKEAEKAFSHKKQPQIKMFGGISTIERYLYVEDFIKTEEHTIAYCHKDGRKSIMFGVTSLSRPKHELEIELSEAIKQHLEKTVFGFRWLVESSKGQKFDEVIEQTFELLSKKLYRE